MKSDLFSYVFSYGFTMLIVIISLLKARRNYKKGIIEYDELSFEDEEAGIRRLDIAALEKMKGGIESTDYVQNNNAMIEKYLSPVNSNFFAKSFVDWAKGLIMDAQKNGFETNPFVIEGFSFPCRFERISMSYLNLYRKKDGMDILKLYFVAEGCENGESKRFFAVFKRKSSFLNTSEGNVRGVSCPYCAGKVLFGNKQVVKCPYCGNTVTLQENDWKLYEIQAVGGNVENIGIIIED